MANNPMSSYKPVQKIILSLVISLLLNGCSSTNIYDKNVNPDLYLSKKYPGDTWQKSSENNPDKRLTICKNGLQEVNQLQENFYRYSKLTNDLLNIDKGNFIECILDSYIDNQLITKAESFWFDTVLNTVKNDLKRYSDDQYHYSTVDWLLGYAYRIRIKPLLTYYTQHEQIDKIDSFLDKQTQFISQLIPLYPKLKKDLYGTILDCYFEVLLEYRLLQRHDLELHIAKKLKDYLQTQSLNLQDFSVATRTEDKSVGNRKGYSSELNRVLTYIEQSAEVTNPSYQYIKQIDYDRIVTVDQLIEALRNCGVDHKCEINLKDEVNPNQIKYHSINDLQSIIDVFSLSHPEKIIGLQEKFVKMQSDNYSKMNESVRLAEFYLTVDRDQDAIAIISNLDHYLTTEKRIKKYYYKGLFKLKLILGEESEALSLLSNIESNIEDKYDTLEHEYFQLHSYYDAKKQYDKALHYYLASEKEQSRFEKALGNQDRFFNAYKSYGLAQAYIKSRQMPEAYESLTAYIDAISENAQQNYSGLDRVQGQKLSASQTKQNLSILGMINQASAPEMTKAALYYSMMMKGLLQRIHTHHSVAAPQRNSPEAIQAQLAPDQVILDFHIFSPNNGDLNLSPRERLLNKWWSNPQQQEIQNHIAVLIVSKDDMEWVNLTDEDTINRLIKDYREKVVASANNRGLGRVSTNLSNLNEIASQLYQKLLTPIENRLMGKKTVYLLPDGQLHLLPFSALQNAKQQYFGVSYDVRLIGSLLDFINPGSDVHVNQVAAIFAAPNYGDYSDGVSQSREKKTVNRSIDVRDLFFDSLPGALAEGKAIATKFNNQKMAVAFFTGDQASEAEIKNTHNPSLLHIATHGYYLNDEFTGLGDNPDPLLKSGLALTNANSAVKNGMATDGILTGVEILNLDLKATNLVTLSACETGVGDIKVGDGVYSLKRAFQQAGAKNILASLWTIDDEGTMRFMDIFYKYYLGSDSIQSAFRKTQLEFIHSNKFKSPYYWAAFTMTGLH